jgi:Predicted Zn-dependent protease (DUF2268)
LKEIKGKVNHKFNVLLWFLLILVLSTTFNHVIYCQDSKPDTIPAKIIELTQGCKLVLDSNINLADTVTIAIVDGIRNIMPRIQKLIPADSIAIDLAMSSSEVLPMFGVGGRTTSDHAVSFYFDPRNPNFRLEFLVRSLVHECFHPTRLRMSHWQLTLLECMITEGLADHFMIELLNGDRPVWSSALTEEEIKQYIVHAKPVLHLKFESWTDEFTQKYFVPWMFGRKGDDPIPEWTGYALGWRIVDNYLKAHPEARASSLVFAPAEVIASSTPELVDSK